MDKYGGYPGSVLSARSHSHRLSVSDWFYSRYCAINQQAVGGALAIHQVSRDNAPARWVTTLSMGALLVLPQRYSVYQVRSGRKQPEQTTCVPGCSWQGPHPFRPHDISLIFSRSLFLLYLIPDTDHILFFVAKTTRFYSIILTCHKSEMLLQY